MGHAIWGNKPKEKLFDWLTCHREITIVGHSNPDPDCMGSTLALSHWLNKRLGITARVFNATPRGDFDFLPGNSDVTADASLLEKPLLVVDCATREGIGPAVPPGYALIDHHIGSAHGNESSWVDSSYSSVGEMIYDWIAPSGGVTPDIANCLYAAIIGDTGGLRFSNTTPALIRKMAEIAELGADPVAMANGVFMQRSYADQLEAAKMWLSSTLENGLLWTKFDCTGAARRPHWMSNELRFTKGAVLTCVASEHKDKTNVSLRSAKMDCERIAKVFGGGGHKGAAAAWVAGPPGTFEKDVLPVLRKMALEPEKYEA